MNANPFQILGMEPSFTLDKALLEKNYFERQALSHPDRFTSERQLDYCAAENTSAQLNKAYETLKNPVLRAESLMELLAILVPGRDGVIIQDPEVLFETMELREELEASTSSNLLDQLKESIEARLEGAHADFNKAWIAKNGELMQKIYIKLTYLQKIRQEIQSHLRELSLKME